MNEQKAFCWYPTNKHVSEMQLFLKGLVGTSQKITLKQT